MNMYSSFVFFFVETLSMSEMDESNIFRSAGHEAGDMTLKPNESTGFHVNRKQWQVSRYYKSYLRVLLY